MFCQESVQIALLDGLIARLDALVFIVVVQRAHHRAVRGFLAHLGQLFDELLHLELAQHLAASAAATAFISAGIDAYSSVRSSWLELVASTTTLKPRASKSKE